MIKLFQVFFIAFLMQSLRVAGNTVFDNFTLNKFKTDHSECTVNNKNDCAKFSFQLKNKLKSNFIISNFFDLNIDYQDVLSKCEKVKYEKIGSNHYISYACITGNYENVGRFYFSVSKLGLIYLRQILVETCYDGNFAKISEAIIEKFNSNNIIKTTPYRGMFEMRDSYSNDSLVVSLGGGFLATHRVENELYKEIGKKYTLVCPGDHKIKFLLKNSINSSDLINNFEKEILNYSAKSNKPNF